MKKIIALVALVMLILSTTSGIASAHYYEGVKWYSADGIDGKGVSYTDKLLGSNYYYYAKGYARTSTYSGGYGKVVYYIYTKGQVTMHNSNGTTRTDYKSAWYNNVSTVATGECIVYSNQYDTGCWASTSGTHIFQKTSSSSKRTWSSYVSHN